jgi:hypothetical protein
MGETLNSVRNIVAIHDENGQKGNNGKDIDAFLRKEMEDIIHRAEHDDINRRIHHEHMIRHILKHRFRELNTVFRHFFEGCYLGVHRSAINDLVDIIEII